VSSARAGEHPQRCAAADGDLVFHAAALERQGGDPTREELWSSVGGNAPIVRFSGRNTTSTLAPGRCSPRSVRCVPAAVERNADAALAVARPMRPASTLAAPRNRATNRLAGRS
jgi:hypothetical protein